MPYLIDGHNLIGQMPGLSLSDPDKEARLVKLLRVYLVRRRKTGTVVFDRGLLGGRSGWSNAQLKVFFASGNTDADTMIVKRIENDHNPRGLIVVSSDHRVQQAARRRGAQVYSAQTFARELHDGPHIDDQIHEHGLSDDEVDEWLSLFERGNDARD